MSTCTFYYQSSGRFSDVGYNPYARKPQKEIEEDEGILEVEYEAPEQEVKKETRGRKPKK